MRVSPVISADAIVDQSKQKTQLSLFRANDRPTGHNPKIGLFPYRPQTSQKRRDPADSNSISALPIPAN